jgi:hypothetical protein
VLLLVYLPTLLVLRFMQLGALCSGHHAIGLGCGFFCFDFGVVFFEAGSFRAGELGRRIILLAALLLLGFTLIHARRLRRGLSQGAAVLVIMSIQGCAVQKQLVPTGGSRADVTIKMSFEYGAFEVPKLDGQQGLSVAK